MKIGESIDNLYDLRQMRLRLEAEAADIKKAELKLEEDLIRALSEQQITSCKGSLATFSYKLKEIPQVNNWNEVYHFIEATGHWELLHKRIGIGAWNDLRQDKIEIPGIEPFTISTTSLTKLKG